MSRHITPEETNELFTFCKKHQIYHYDVQIELVDHMASAIEEQWEEDSELNFNIALKRTFSKFGIYGFSKIEKQKARGLKKKYNRLLLRFVLEFYRWPKVISTFVFTIGLFLIFQIIEQDIWIILAYSLSLFLGIIIYHFFFHKRTKLNIKPGKTFLMEEQYKRVTSLYALVIQLPNFTYHAFNYGNTRTIENQWILLIISFSLVAFTVLLYGNFFYLPKKIKEHFLEQFAEFAV
jgi:hypothetical protein